MNESSQLVSSEKSLIDEINSIQNTININLNKLDQIISKEFNNETRYILINESRKIKNEIKILFKKMIETKDNLFKENAKIKIDLDSKKKHLQDNMNVDSAVKIFCTNCLEEFSMKNVKEKKVNKICNYHPGKIKYYSCKGCGSIEYFSCCGKCINCLKTCKKGNHLCEFFVE